MKLNPTITTGIRLIFNLFFLQSDRKNRHLSSNSCNRYLKWKHGPWISFSLFQSTVLLIAKAIFTGTGTFYQLLSDWLDNWLLAAMVNLGLPDLMQWSWNSIYSLCDSSTFGPLCYLVLFNISWYDPWEMVTDPGLISKTHMESIEWFRRSNKKGQLSATVTTTFAPPHPTPISPVPPPSVP